MRVGEAGVAELFDTETRMGVVDGRDRRSGASIRVICSVIELDVRSWNCTSAEWRSLEIRPCALFAYGDTTLLTYG